MITLILRDPIILKNPLRTYKERQAATTAVQSSAMVLECIGPRSCQESSAVTLILIVI